MSNRELYKGGLSSKVSEYKVDLFFIPHVAKICGTIGGCELSTRKLNVHLAISCGNLIKNCETQLKVVKHLPYEIMLGRQDMIKTNLTLTDAIGEEKKGGTTGSKGGYVSTAARDVG